MTIEIVCLRILYTRSLCATTTMHLSTATLILMPGQLGNLFVLSPYKLRHRFPQQLRLSRVPKVPSKSIQSLKTHLISLIPRLKIY